MPSNHPCARPPVPQAGFKRDLIREVRAFVADAQAFRRDWDASGPMVAGLDPMEAMDRLRKFQQMFEVRTDQGLTKGTPAQGRPLSGSL